MASKRQRWLVLLTSVLVLVWLVSFLTRERQPSYDGNSLSDWLEIYASERLFYPTNQQTGSIAIRHIGTNAIPYLLKWVSYEPSEIGTGNLVFRLVNKLPKGIRPAILVEWTRSDFKNEVRAIRAAQAFALFRDESSLCIPPLVKLMKENKSPYTVSQAVYALAWIGPDAMPVFAATLADTNAPPRVRSLIVYGLGPFPDLATNSVSSLTLLLPCLHDANSEVRDYAIAALGRIGQENRSFATSFVPALTNCLQSSFPVWTRCAAMHALGLQSNEARIAVPLLLTLTNSPDSYLRTGANSALLSIAPEVLTNGPVK